MVDSNTLLERLNKDALWHNPRRFGILSSQLGISTIALMRRVRRRGIIRGPYVIDDREQRKVVASKRSQLIKSYAELTGDPLNQGQGNRQEIRDDRTLGPAKAPSFLKWYRREFDTATLEERAKLVKLLNRNERWKSGAVKAVAKELGVSKVSLKLRMSRWSILRGPYIQLPQPKPGPSRPNQYARAFQQSSGEPATRIRRIAKQHGVKPSSVRAALRTLWGPERYQDELGIRRHSHEALLALMNDPKIQKSHDVLGAAARKLGIKRDSLKSILSRKGIRRTGRSSYSQDLLRARPAE